MHDPIAAEDTPSRYVRVHEPAAQLHEVLGALGSLEADQVGPEEALDDRAPPWDPHEQFNRREGDVEEESDA